MIDIFEPFLGGGAVFFSLVSKKRKAKWLISDLNSDLILSYVTIRDKVKELVSSLENHAENYSKNQSTYFYKVREANPNAEIDKVSRLIFLNKTCFNGLYRVNSKGKFNVPVGKYINPNIVNKENLFEVSKILQSKDISIKCQDFEDALKGVGKEILYIWTHLTSQLVLLQALQAILIVTLILVIKRDSLTNSNHLTKRA